MKMTPVLLNLALTSTAAAQSGQMQWEYLVVRHRDVMPDSTAGIRPYFELQTFGEPVIYSPKEFEAEVRKSFSNKGLQVFSQYSLMESEIVNYFGLQGWELVDVSQTVNSSNAFDKMNFYYFKRVLRK